MIFEKNGRKIAVMSLLGVAGFKRVHLKNPFSLLPKLLESITPETNAIVLDFHAVTTAEKATMFAMADGKLSAVIGTHTKALTADDRVLAGGTAVITDAGQDGEHHLRCGAGPRDRDPEAHHPRARVLQGSLGGCWRCRESSSRSATTARPFRWKDSASRARRRPRPPRSRTFRPRSDRAGRRAPKHRGRRD